MNKQSLLYLIVTCFLIFGHVKSMDQSGSFWTATRMITYLKDIPGNLLGKSSNVYKETDYFSELPDPVILDYIVPKAIKEFDLINYHGVKAAIIWMANCRKINKKMSTILSNNKIARILKETEAQLNDVDIYDTEVRNLSFSQLSYKIFETYPVPNHQFSLLFFANNDSFGIAHVSGNFPRTTLIQWAAKKGYVTLIDILIMADAAIPKTVLPQLEKLGIDLSHIPEKQLI